MTMARKPEHFSIAAPDERKGIDRDMLFRYLDENTTRFYERYVSAILL